MADLEDAKAEMKKAEIAVHYAKKKFEDEERALT